MQKSCEYFFWLEMVVDFPAKYIDLVDISLGYNGYCAIHGTWLIVGIIAYKVRKPIVNHLFVNKILTWKIWWHG